MTEKRFSIELQNNDIYDKETNTFYCDNDSICNLLNEQQELIEELHISDHMGWGRAEKFEKELKQKKIYIKRLEYKVQKFKEENGEQQATIRKLQDLCGKSDGENMKLQIENKKLKEEIRLLKPTNIEQYEQIQKLRKELNDCEKFRYTTFKRMRDVLDE